MQIFLALFLEVINFMNPSYSQNARVLIPSVRTCFLHIKRANNRNSINEALNLTLITLKGVRRQMLDTKEAQNIPINNEISSECLFFETALINLGLAIRFLQLRVITPENKPELLRVIYSVYSHLKKCHLKNYR